MHVIPALKTGFNNIFVVLLIGFFQEIVHLNAEFLHILEQGMFSIGFQDSLCHLKYLATFKL